MSHHKEELFVRFNTAQIIQHVLWAISFAVLAMSGLALKYPENHLSQWIVSLLGGHEGREIAHRLAAILWAGTGFSHIIYYTFYYKGERPIMWEKKDWEDFRQSWRYVLGKSDDEPKFGRYAWYEKFDYWASWIGVAVMTITGLMMLFAFPVMKFIPLAVLEWGRVIHGWEAILAVLVILEFHFYMTIFRPKIFPMAKQWLTGTLTREEMEEEHPLELEEILKRR